MSLNPLQETHMNCNQRVFLEKHILLIFIYNKKRVSLSAWLHCTIPLKYFSSHFTTITVNPPDIKSISAHFNLSILLTYLHIYVNNSHAKKPLFCSLWAQFFEILPNIWFKWGAIWLYVFILCKKSNIMKNKTAKV